MTSTSECRVAGHLPQELRDRWSDIVRHGEPGPPFHAELVNGLPAPAQRWLCYAIESGSPLRRCVELEMHGRIKLGRWHGFTARQVLSAEDGYIWAERTRVIGLPVSGYDRLVDGVGEMRHWTVGHVPVVAATGTDITVSAAGRFAAELAYLPALALDRTVSWTRQDADTAVATVGVLGLRHAVTLTVRPNGEPRRVSLDRWSQFGGRQFGMHRFVAELGRMRRFDGYAIPTWVRAGYARTGGELVPFIEQFVDDATFH